jgi:hypothetical protein
MSSDPHHYDELSANMSTGSSDLYTGDTTQAVMDEQPVYCDEDGSTTYSDFCDDETISAAAVTYPYPATTLGKRRSFDRSEPSLSASYKRQTISDAVPDAAEPYIIVRELFSGNSKCSPLCQQEHKLHNTSVQRAMDTRGLPWGVQWEIARLISLGHCTWKDVAMTDLDLLRKEGLSPSDSVVLSAPIAPYVEGLFRRWHKTLHKGSHQRLSKETQATVSHSLSLSLAILTNYLYYSHHGLS